MRTVLILILAAYCAAVPLARGAASPAYNYTVANGTEQCIDEYGLKKKVKNNCARDIFVPTKTADEWQSFVSNIAANTGCVQISNCLSGCCTGGASMSTGFSYQRTAPLTIQFTDTSTGTELWSSLWDFGDGQTSTLRNPTHVYASGGTYRVRIDWKCDCGSYFYSGNQAKNIVVN